MSFNLYFTDPLQFHSRMWVGAGAVHNKSLEGIQSVMKNEDIDGIIFGSITMQEQLGNPGTTFQGLPYATLNSIGLRNLGYKKYASGELADIISFVHEKEKQIIVSVAGDSPEDYATLATGALAAGADGVELNLGCPNKWGPDGTQKEIAAYNEKLIARILDVVIGSIGGFGVSHLLGVKVSPYEPGMLRRVADVFNTIKQRFGVIDYVASANTFPNCYMEDDHGVPCISPHSANKNGFGGMAGKAFALIAQGQVRQFREALLPSIHIMGVGGIYTGADMDRYIRLGADAVQVVSAFYETEDPGIFSRILGEYQEIQK